MPAPRRPHNKTRTGCINCRKRRVKCSEERPKCLSCARRGTPCNYPPTPTGKTPGTSIDPAHHDVPLARKNIQRWTPGEDEHYNPFGARLAADVVSGADSPPTYTAREMALLHHWTVSTSIELYRTPRMNFLWQMVVPQIGLESPFLLQALLSLSALHLAYLARKSKSPVTRANSSVQSHITEATRLHNQALQGFQEAVTSISDDNSEALLTWSMTNIVYVLEMSKHNSSDANTSEASRRDYILGVDWVPMMRGVEAVLRPTFAYVSTSRLRGLVAKEQWKETDPDTEPYFSRTEDYQFRRIRETWDRKPDREVYDKALWMLRKCHAYEWLFERSDDATTDDATHAGPGLPESSPLCSGGVRSWASPFTFVYCAPQEYFKLLHQRQPQALILFAFFGALLHKLTDYWFLEDRGRDIVEVVDDLLGNYWRPWISWPLEVVGRK